MAKNPSWTRDELILALDLYFCHNPLTINYTHPKVIKLSEILNALSIHPDHPDEAKFTNPNGVYMKLCNFLRFDPNYQGAGLAKGSKLEEIIWNEFYHDQVRLNNVANSIKASSHY